MPNRPVKMREKDFAILKKYCNKHGLLMTEVLGKAVGKLEAKKLESEEIKTKEIEFDTCDECGEDVPEDACFCPYCGVEFEEDDE